MSDPSTAPAPGLGRHLALLVATVVTTLGAAVGATAVTTLTTDPPSPSREAADRPCPTLPPAERPHRLPGLRLAARRIADVDEPASVAFQPGGDGEGVIAERAGRIVRIAQGAVTEQVVLDLRSDTTDEGDGGLLGVAYDPGGPWLYVYRATHDRDDVLTAYPLDDEGLPRRAGGRELLRVDHPPSEQHHGGSLLFGPDRMLYIGFGDGGGLGDPHENAQDPSTLLGKVVRIDPTPGDERPYRVPPDNPFVGRFGWATEIWLLGVRNPFRMSLDETTGDLWLGDVGQSCWEELDRLPTGPGGAGGSNLGWDRVEGGEPFEGGTVHGEELRPVHTYPHSGGRCAVVAGYVVRGPTIPELDGWLLLADYCAGRLLALHTDADPDGDDADGDRGLPAEPSVVDLGIEIDSPVAIVPGPGGWPWVLSLDGAIYELAPR